MVGRRDIEDALERLDRLTQEEARMATAEVLRLTQKVDGKVEGVGEQVEGVNKGVQGIDGKVQGVDERVQGVDERVQGVDHKVQDVDDRVKLIVDGGDERSAAIQRIVNTVDDMNRNQLRRDLRNWISPPDPSINYNTACGAHHEGTAAWLSQGDAFGGWKSSGSLLWVHGKPGSGKSILSSVSSKISKVSATPGLRRWHTFISTSRTLQSKITVLSYPPFSSSSLINLMFTATFFWTCTLPTVRAQSSQATTHSHDASRPCS